MSIVTKVGDEGLTSLSCGKMVMKDHAKIEANGAIDELCSHLGTAKSLIKKRATKRMVESIQRDLLIICAEIALGARSVNRLKDRIDASSVRRLDGIIKDIEKKGVFKAGRGFYIPGEDFISSILDIARAVARRAERRVVTLKKRRMLKNVHITAYLNRLSDLLYLLVRCHEKGSCKF
jgi:ATP:cob(I)alamin adenosyltransferase